MKYQNEGVFMDKKSLYFYVYATTGMSLGKVKMFLFQRLSQTWFSGWLAWFETKFQRQSVLTFF